MVLAHGREELLGLAGLCRTISVGDVNGWIVDCWHMTDADVDCAIAAYDAVLAGGASDGVVALLEDAGIDLDRLLTNDGTGKDDITRSDVTELVAAASLLAAPGCDCDGVHMPNVPKMSRRKSDSGLDVAFVTLATSGGEDLEDGDLLDVVSVKHTIDDSTSSMRWKLARSLSPQDLTPAYMAQQLRVLNARLQAEGVPADRASRVYLFLRDFPDPDRVRLFGVGVADPGLKVDFEHNITLLPEVSGGNYFSRMVLFPGLGTVHERCS